MDFISGLLQQAKNKLKELDRAAGGWIPGGGIASPATRLVQQSTNILRNPAKQLKNPETYKAWQANQSPLERFSANERVQAIGGVVSPQPGVAFRNPITGTYVYMPVNVEGFYNPDLGLGSETPSSEIHFGGPEGNLSRAEARKEWMRSWKDKPEELFGATDPAKERARGLALRAQIGRGLQMIEPGTWINTSAQQSAQNSRAKLYDRMTGGVFATNPETGSIDVYKESPTTWRNIANPDKQLVFDPKTLIKPLEREAFQRPDISSLRETPGGTVVEALTRRFGGPYVQAGMLLDDAVKQVTGVSPVGAILNAAQEQLRRSTEKTQQMGVRVATPWQTAPF